MNSIQSIFTRASTNVNGASLKKNRKNYTLSTLNVLFADHRNHLNQINYINNNQSNNIKYPNRQLNNQFNHLSYRYRFYSISSTANNIYNEGSENTKLPLQGIQVLDLTRVLAGPFCSQNLADLGAHVIKIEHIQSGDDTREWGPPYFYKKDTKNELRHSENSEIECSAYFATCNRSKKSLALDLKTKEGKEIIQELVKQSHIFMENFSTGVTERLGIDYETLSKINPDLIYSSISGFGRTGAYKYRPGYDFLIQGMSGVMDLTGEPDREPQKIGMALIDVLTGMYTTQAILASLIAKKGQHIDISLFDSALTGLVNQAQNFLATGKSPTRKGNEHPNIAPYALYHCSDGPIILTIGNDHQFRKFAELIQLSNENLEIFSSNEKRVLKRKELAAIINSKLCKQTRAYWMEHLNELGVPCGPVNTVEEAFNEQPALDRNMIWEFPGTNIKTVGNPIKFSETKIENKNATPPPRLGEHTNDILISLGYSEEEILKLRKKKVIF